MGRIRNLWVLLGLVLFTVSVCDIHVSADVIPSENECRPYIEKAIHELKNNEATEIDDDKESTENGSIENEPEAEEAADDGGEKEGKSAEDGSSDDNQSDENGPSQENQTEENENTSTEEPAAEQDTAEDLTQENDSKNDENDTVEEKSVEDEAESGEKNDEADADSNEDAVIDGDSKEDSATEGDSKEDSTTDGDSKEDGTDGDSQEPETADSDDNDSKENTPEDGNDSKENDDNDSNQTEEKQDENSGEPAAEGESEQADDEDSGEKNKENVDKSSEDENQTTEDQADSKEEETAADDTNEEESVEETIRSKRSIPDGAENEQSDEQDDAQANDNESQENVNQSSDDNQSQENASEDVEQESEEEATEGAEDVKESLENDEDTKEDDQENVEGSQENAEGSQENAEGSQENTEGSQENTEDSQENEEASQDGSEQESTEGDENDEEDEEQEPMPEEDLTMEFEIPKNLRPRAHVNDLLGLDAESSIKENALKQTGDFVLKELKRIFDNAIHPLESMYKYRDLSNRHFGDPEIFSKPLVLFMGPWSGGKSTILNYLTDNEYTPNSIRSGAEPSPAYFNILMHGDEPEVLDGTQLAADWTFSGLQKFGQGLMDRLRGQKLPSKLLERVNIVEIPGILEVRKQVSRYFPFNDACQWFIDRADIIFLVYDPSKLDVGPETEAILDQLKGREYQTRILLNKADQVKPEELLRVQGALIWNISPLMSSAQPPIMYTVSLWSHPFENGAPIRLLQAQERAFLTDLREAIDKRIENKIASARRFAVRIRNHAKMVDCYLTTYYNQKGLFSNKKQVSDKIIEHPQNYNIYEGLSTLTNISRYDLPDPEVYLDFFRLNPLYEFKKLSETCTYFKGCPINKLDIAIAYDLPELVGKYKKLLEQNLTQLRKEYDENCNQTEIDPPVKIINSR